MLLEAVRSAARMIPGVLALRLLPFVGFILISRRVAWPLRIVAPVAYVLIARAAAGTGSTPFHWLLLAYGYFITAAWAAFQLSTPSRSRLGWFSIVLLLFWILPVIAVEPIPTAFLIVGWELIFAAYSYHVDTAHATDRSFGEFLFFLLVNPALVYRNRGDRIGAAGFRPMGAARVALGIAAVFLSFVIVNLAPLIASHRFTVHSDSLTEALLTPAAGFLRLTKEYAAHSGVASIQIGILLMLGYRIPERYRYPLFARNPSEFWRRWNTYVGNWASVYVFTPLALRWIRARRRNASKRSSSAGELRLTSLAVVITFGSIGLLHDLFVVSTEQELGFRATGWFVAVGSIVVVWEVVARSLSLRTRSSRLRSAVERFVFLVAASCAAAKLW